jgi:hypothetical protein
MAGLALAVLPQEMQLNAMRTKHLRHAFTASQVRAMIPPRAYDELGLARRAQDGRVVAAPDGILH